MLFTLEYDEVIFHLHQIQTRKRILAIFTNVIANKMQLR